MEKYIIELKKGEIAYKTVDSKGTPMIQLLNPLPYAAPDLEKVRKEAYEKGWKEAEDHYEEGYNDGYDTGLDDAWECARKISSMDSYTRDEVFGLVITSNIFDENTASEAIEEIRAHEQAQKELEESKKERSFTAEEVMRQYLDTYCLHNKSCIGCPLRTPDFTCGRGYHFLGKNPVSDEEVRRAYATVLAKMKES